MQYDHMDIDVRVDALARWLGCVWVLASVSLLSSSSSLFELSDDRLLLILTRLTGGSGSCIA